MVAEQIKQDTSQKLAKKVFQRAELVEKGKEKARKIEASIKALESETIIATTECLKEREDAILSLCFPDKLKEGEVDKVI